MRPLALSLAAALARRGRRPPRRAPSVTLNGVNIDGVTGQKFENCTVVIDEQGNVHIEAKGYAVKASAARSRSRRAVRPRTRAPAAASQPPPTRAAHGGRTRDPPLLHRDRADAARARSTTSPSSSTRSGSAR